MNVFIAGICGTFMAGIAQIAQSLGHRVSGCDTNVYPPMSDVLANAGIYVYDGYLAAHLNGEIDIVVIGNALSRGNPMVEYILDHYIPYTSGPAWLHDHVLRQRKVIAVAGTHGKTTTSSMLAWIMHESGMEPGFLIGGKPGNFEHSARPGIGEWFVIEADEYDTAFFDKRSKFVHYAPTVALLNNLEFDHADIFDDIDQIKKQFHHLVRIVPGKGSIVWNAGDQNLGDVLQQGMWSALQSFSADTTAGDWQATAITPEASSYTVTSPDGETVDVHWNCIGQHNMLNGLSAIAASSIAGVSPQAAARVLGRFTPAARRLQNLSESPNHILYEDFAHHPTAIECTLQALRAAHPDDEIIAILEPRSNSMRMGRHDSRLASALSDADRALFYVPAKLDWYPESVAGLESCSVYQDADSLLDSVATIMNTNNQKRRVFVAMSNGGFDGLPAKIAGLLESHRSSNRVTVLCTG